MSSLRGESRELVGDRGFVLDEFAKKLITSCRGLHPFGETCQWEDWRVAFWDLSLSSQRSEERWLGCEGDWWRNWEGFVNYLHWDGKSRIFFSWRRWRIKVSGESRSYAHRTFICARSVVVKPSLMTPLESCCPFGRDSVRGGTIAAWIVGRPKAVN